MKIEIARQDDRMAPSGSAILRSLQNESLSVVDLVVRESFQNSLDAGLDNVDSVNIDVKTNKIRTQSVAPYFSGLTNNLMNKLPKETTVISIADSNTSGLTGEFNTTDPKKLAESNIYKLIYGINMNQEDGDAGGSWGLGKTSFFRIGSGIVIYYSRIRTKIGTYEERLAACLIEDSSKDDALMSDNPRGIAWWGEKNENTSKYDKTYPITDGFFIRKFLKEFGLEPYKGDETGTNIIIPFIDEEKIVVHKDDDLLNDEVYWWETSLTDSINMAIKRWYFPRLFNPQYKEKFDQPYLTSKLNKDLVLVTEKDITFHTFRELYNAALTNQTSNSDITVKEVKLKQMGMKSNTIPVGRIAYQKKKFTNLGVKNGSGLLPTAYIGDKDGSRRDPGKILGYARKPGMVVEYVVNDNDWMGGVHAEKDEFIFSFFVPNSDGLLHDRYRQKYQTLENYLRDTENADHANWTDIYIDKYQVTMIKRIKKEISKIMASDFGESLEAISSRRTSSLSRKFGQLFLPKMDFGKSGTAPRKKKSGASGVRTGRTNAVIDIIRFNRLVEEDIVEVVAKISLPKKSTHRLAINVVTTDKILNSTSWNKTFGDSIQYPFIISEVNVDDDGRVSLEVEDVDSTNHYHLINNSESVASSQISFKFSIKDITMKPTLALIKVK